MKTLEELRAQFPQYADVSDGDFLIGLNRKFYPNMHPREFLNSIEGAANAHVTIKNDAIKSWYRENVQKPMAGEDAGQTEQRLGGMISEAQPTTGGTLANAARGALQGLTFGTGDEIVAAGVSALSDKTYDQALADERQRIEMGRSESPVASYGGEIAGAMAMPLGALSGGGSLGARVGRSAVTSGLLGGAYGFGTGEGGLANRLSNAAGVGAVSGAIGGLLPIVGAGASRVYNRAMERAAANRAIKAAPTPQALRNEASAIYNAADNAVLPRQPFTSEAQSMVANAARQGMDPDLTPGAAKVADRIMDAATSPDPNLPFSELDILRRKAGVPAGNLSNRTESAIGSQFVGAIDDFVEGVDPALSKEIGKARDMWGRLRRSDLIENAIERAKNQASGFENGLRVQFRAILNNPKLLRGFSEAERNAMREVVEGTTFGNLMKKIGVVGLSGGQGGTGLGMATGAGMGATVGTMMGGPIGGAIGGVLPLAIGTGAKKLAERATTKAAERAQGLVAAGGVRGPIATLPAGAQAQLEAMLRRGLLPLASEVAPQGGLLPQVARFR